MNKKGFTLIELLAVIVILAIIALIATPIVLSIINNSKESAQLRSAEMYLKGLETSVATATLNERNVPDGTYPIASDGNICLKELTNKTCSEEDTLVVDMNGEKPKSGSVTIESGKITDISLTYSNEKTVVRNPEGSLVYEGVEVTEYASYNVGDEVSVGGESFYVIEASDSSKSTVILLSKYNLNTAGTTQLNVSSSETKCAFSDLNYWSSAATFPLNLNELTIPDGTNSVIAVAETYGITKGGTGRLLTYEEANQLKETHEGIIYGTNIGAVDGSLYYWLATAYDPGTVYTITGSGDYSSTFGHGVRPVVEISKSKIN